MGSIFLNLSNSKKSWHEGEKGPFLKLPLNFKLKENPLGLPKMCSHKFFEIKFLETGLFVAKVTIIRRKR